MSLNDCYSPLSNKLTGLAFDERKFKLTCEEAIFLRDNRRADYRSAGILNVRVSNNFSGIVGKGPILAARLFEEIQLLKCR